MLVLVVIILALASVEYFDKVTEKGYRPATIVGIAATIAMPIAADRVGETALPLILVLAFAAAATGFLGGRRASSRARCRTWPSPPSASPGSPSSACSPGSILKVLTVGLFNASGGVTFDAGTDTLFLLTLGV